MSGDPASRGRLLLVDAEPATRWAVARALRGWKIQTASGGELATADAPGRGPDLALLGAADTREDSVRRVKELRARHAGLPVILLDAGGDGCSAAMLAGAFDCLRKPVEPDALLLAVQRALDWRRLQQENHRLGHALELLRRREEIAGRRTLPGRPCELLSCALRERLSLREVEDRYVDSVLRLTGGNKVRASQILGIARRTLYRRKERKSGVDEGAASAS